MIDDTQNFAPNGSATLPPQTPPFPQETAEIQPATDSATAELLPTPVVASSDPSATASFLALASPAAGSPTRATVDHAFAEAGEADALAQKFPRQTRVRLALARCYAVCARRATEGKQALAQKALARLEELFKGGYRDNVTLETDPDFDALRDDPALRALTARR
jgi:hypothetical protein